MASVRVIVQRKPHGKLFNPESDETWMYDPELLAKLAAAGLREPEVDHIFGWVWGTTDDLAELAAVSGVLGVHEAQRAAIPEEA